MSIKGQGHVSNGQKDANHAIDNGEDFSTSWRPHAQGYGQPMSTSAPLNDPYGYYPPPSFPYHQPPPYAPPGDHSGAWSNGDPSMTFLSGFGGQTLGHHDSYTLEGMFSPSSFGGFGQPNFGYGFHGNSEYPGPWGGIGRPKYDDYYRDPMYGANPNAAVAATPPGTLPGPNPAASGAPNPGSNHHSAPGMGVDMDRNVRAMEHSMGGLALGANHHAPPPTQPHIPMQPPPNVPPSHPPPPVSVGAHQQHQHQHQHHLQHHMSDKDGLNKERKVAVVAPNVPPPSGPLPHLSQLPPTSVPPPPINQPPPPVPPSTAAPVSSSSAAPPKKTTTWASIAGQPAKPPLKGRRMMNSSSPVLPIGAWDTSGSKSSGKPGVIPPPPTARPSAWGSRVPPPSQPSPVSPTQSPANYPSVVGGNAAFPPPQAAISPNPPQLHQHQHQPQPPPPSSNTPPSTSAAQPSSSSQTVNHDAVSNHGHGHGPGPGHGHGPGPGHNHFSPSSASSSSPHQQHQGPSYGHQQHSPPVSSAVAAPPTSHQASFSNGPADHGEAPAPILDSLKSRNNYNPREFTMSPEGARFFVIKSYSEDDIHRSIKYEIWCSTEHGNKRLDQAFREREGKGPIYLFFSVNGSGHFCGMAQMLSHVDYNSSSSVWAQDKWKGSFKVKWIYVKDVPNGKLRHIKLENNENKPVTNSRDTQEVPPEKGKMVLKEMHNFKHTTSIFDDFFHYEQRQIEEEERRHSVPPPNSMPGPPKDDGPRGGGGDRDRDRDRDRRRRDDHRDRDRDQQHNNRDIRDHRDHRDYRDHRGGFQDSSLRDHRDFRDRRDNNRDGNRDFRDRDMQRDHERDGRDHYHHHESRNGPARGGHRS